MAHEVAKLMLEHAETFLERTEAIRVALNLGMPLHEIEAYLDWLDSIRDAENPSAKNRRPDAPQ
jgi:DNA-binding transcriptional MerR regulator